MQTGAACIHGFICIILPPSLPATEWGRLVHLEGGLEQGQDMLACQSLICCTRPLHCIETEDPALCSCSLIRQHLLLSELQCVAAVQK